MQEGLRGACLGDVAAFPSRRAGFHPYRWRLQARRAQPDAPDQIRRARTSRAPRRPSSERPPTPSARIPRIPAIPRISECAQPDTVSRRPPRRPSAPRCPPRPCRHRLSRRRSPPVCRSRPRPGIRRCVWPRTGARGPHPRVGRRGRSVPTGAPRGSRIAHVPHARILHDGIWMEVGHGRAGGRREPVRSAGRDLDAATQSRAD